MWRNECGKSVERVWDYDLDVMMGKMPRAFFAQIEVRRIECSGDQGILPLVHLWILIL